MEELLESILKKKKELEEKIERLEKKKKEFLPPWKKFEGKEEKVGIAAEDGSYNYLATKSFILYVVSSAGIFFKDKLKKIMHFDVDILHPYRYAEDRIRLRMQILEGKISLAVFKEFDPDLLLLDGSLLSYIIRPLSFTVFLPKNVREKVKEDYLELLEENTLGMKIFSKELVGEIEKKFPEHLAEIVGLLEYLEHLCCAKQLLENYKERIVSIAKTSTASDYFNTTLPDMMIFEKFSREAGYSLPLHLQISKRMKRKFIAFDEFFRNQEFTIFYARLEKGKSVLKFEVPRKIGSEEIEEILNRIKGISVKGYPYLLKKAHEESSVKEEYLYRIMKILGIEEKSGREVLE